MIISFLKGHNGVNMIYGYARISKPQQSIDRQIRNIKLYNKNAHIVQETYTGTKIARPEWAKLYNKIKFGDTIIFDSVSRMSRSADEGVELYFELYEKGVQLVFLKEHHIDTATYDSAVQQSISSTGNGIADIYIDATNKVINLLAKKQIIQAFEQSEKEVEDLQQRTREGIETARLNGKQIGQKLGNKLHVKKEAPAKEKIKKYSKDFYGTLSDIECMKLIGISRNTYYKYKKDISNNA